MTSSSATRVRRSLPDLLPEALGALCAPDPAKGAPEDFSSELWRAAGIGAELAALLEVRFQRAGRDVTRTIFALHAIAGAAKIQGESDALEELAPHRAALNAWMADPDWRAVWMGWVETLSGRLTMTRYNGRRARRAQSRALIAAPVQAAARLLDPPPGWDETSEAALLDCAEALLRYADLAGAGEMARRGWNRLSAPEGAGNMGGFYGLGETPEVVEPEKIRAAAVALADDLKALPVDALAAPLDVIASNVIALMRAALESFIATGAWPPPGRSSLARLMRRLRPG